MVCDSYMQIEKMTRFGRLIRSSRLSEVIALLTGSTALFLYIHTVALNSQLQELQNSYREAARQEVKPARTLLSGKHQVKPTEINIKHIPSAYELNNTRKAPVEKLFFNRVPKVGSQTMMALLSGLSHFNKFYYHKDRQQKKENIKLTLMEEKQLVQLVNVFRPPAVYIKHVCYVNFTSWGLDEPIYVNMVRHPIERVISWFYYIRASWYFIERKQVFPDLPLPDPKWLRKDFDSCVLSNDKECTFDEGSEREDFGQLTEFFCGQHEKCTGFNTEFALQKAKQVVEEKYAVVGILEDFNTTLTVLEEYIPRFFKNAKRMYWEKIHQNVNKNIYKPPVSEKVKNILKKKFFRELEFYDFCKQRLQLQYLALKKS